MPKYRVVLVETFGTEVEAKTSDDARQLGRKTINLNPKKHHLDEYVRVVRVRETTKNETPAKKD